MRDHCERDLLRREANLHPLKERQAFDIADRNAVLKNQSRVISAQRQASLRRHAHQEEFDAAPVLETETLYRSIMGRTTG